MKEQIPRISGGPDQTSFVPDPDAPPKKESRWTRWLKKKQQEHKDSHSHPKKG